MPGVRDLTANPGLALVIELLRGLEVEHFEEVEEDGETAVGDPKHWHLFHVVARQR